MYNIHYLNKISEKGTALWTEDYALGAAANDADAALEIAIQLGKCFCQGSCDFLGQDFVEITPGNTGAVGGLHAACTGTGNTL